MQYKIRNAWIDALNSGEYKQTTGALKCNDGYCCLGVLVDVLQKQFPDLIKDFTIQEDNSHYLRILDKHGIQVNDGGIGTFLQGLVGMHQEEERILISMNDTSHLDFKTIAEHIERTM